MRVEKTELRHCLVAFSHGEIEAYALYFLSFSQKSDFSLRLNIFFRGNRFVMDQILSNILGVRGVAYNLIPLKKTLVGLFKLIEEMTFSNMILLGIPFCKKSMSSIFFSLLIRFFGNKIHLLRDSFAPHINSKAIDLCRYPLFVESTFKQIYIDVGYSIEEYRPTFKEYFDSFHAPFSELEYKERNKTASILIISKYLRNDVAIEQKRKIIEACATHPLVKRCDLILHPRESREEVSDLKINILNEYYFSLVKNYALIISFHSSVAWTVKMFYRQLVVIDVFSADFFVSGLDGGSRWREFADYSVGLSQPEKVASVITSALS